MTKFIFILAILFSSSLLAQDNSPKFQIPESFIVKSRPAFILPVIGVDRSLLTNPQKHFENTNFHLPQSVKFPAFFCRMELKSVDHCNFWIKVHAGDYDKYSQDKLPD